MRKLILIRHGETDYIAQGKYCGHEDIPLNIKGMEQAKYLGENLKNIKVDRIYSSDLKRALQTASIAFRGRAILARKELREIDFGHFSGLTFNEAKVRYPDIYRKWIENPATAKMVRGENMLDFARRVEDCFKKIRNQNPKKTIALVNHGGPIRIILLKILSQNLDEFWTLEQDIAAINIIQFKNGIPKILKFNDTSYLE